MEIPNYRHPQIRVHDPANARSVEAFIRYNVASSGLYEHTLPQHFLGFERELFDLLDDDQRQDVRLREYFYQRVMEATELNLFKMLYDEDLLIQLADNPKTAVDLHFRLLQFSGRTKNYDVYLYYLKMKKNRSQISDTMFELLEFYLSKIGVLV